MKRNQSSEGRQTAVELRRSDEEIRRDVTRGLEVALTREAEREAKRIQVRVSDANVRLVGEVASWEEREAIEKGVRETPGVLAVDNELRIEER